MGCQAVVSMIHSKALIEQWAKDARLLDSYSPVAYFASLVAKHEAEKLQNELVSLNSNIETLKQALLEVIKVLESDDSAIVDTVWVSTGQPETLRDHCHHAVYGYLHEGEERA